MSLREADQCMTRTIEEDLLARAAEDWVHPSELLAVVRRSGVSEPGALRDLAVGLMARLLLGGLIVVGDVGDTHVPWSGTPGEIIQRVVRDWSGRDDPYVVPGELFWIDTTPAGQRLGEAVWVREADAPRPLQSLRPHGATAMTIGEFGRGPWRREYESQPEMDPLTEDDALVDAQVLDLRLDALCGRVAVLFELRLALELREGNTGLLIADGVTAVGWDAAPRDTARTAWNVVGSVVRSTSGLLEMRLGTLPQAELLVRAKGAAFYSGDVPGLAEIPDYGEAPDSELGARLARWESSFRPLHAVFYGSDPSDG